MKCTVWNWFTFAIICFCSSSKGNNMVYRIEEEVPAHTFISDLSKAPEITERYSPSDLDKIHFSFLSPEQEETQYFNIEESTGVLKTASKLDRDVICRGEDTCLLPVSIAISPAEFFYVFTVEVELLDLNDNIPSFGTPSILLRLPESSRIGKVLSLPQAVDPDTSRFTIKSYELVTVDDIPFNLERTVALDGSTELKLVLQANIDRETRSFYHFAIVAEDGGNPPRSGTLDVNITVEDTNDHIPVFERQNYETDVTEDARIGTTITAVSAYDSDIGPNGQIIFALAPRTNERYGHLFGVDEVSGELYIRQELDFESESKYHLVITATDMGPDSQTAQTTVTVNVLDINDFVPLITINTFTETDEAQVLENVDPGTFVSHVSVIDKDGGEAGQVTCGIGSSDFELKPLDTSQYTIITKSVFDREVDSRYVIHLRCDDKGEPSLSASYNLTVQVSDANDHAPKFDKTLYSPKIEENTPAGEVIVKVKATDDDIGDNAKIEFFLSQNNLPEIFTLFEMEPRTGVVRTLGVMDHERNQTISFEVLARDCGEPPQTAVAQISLNVLDLNDNPPMFTQQAGYSFGLYENRLAGESISNVVAIDNDSEPYDSVLYSLQPIQFDPEGYDVIDKFRIDSQSGYLFTRLVLDREEKDTYYMNVVAVNPGYPEMVGTASVTIYITDENDNDPVIDFPSALNHTVYVRNNEQMGHVITRVRARDLDFGDNAALSFGLDGVGDETFEVDETTGAVTVNADLTNLIDLQFNLTVQAEDHGDPRRRQSALLVIVVTDANSHGGAGEKNKDKKSNGALPNFGIVIGVACGSTVVIALLALAIIIISCKGKNQARKSSAQYQGQYNCRTTEAQRMLNGRPDNRSPSESSGGSQMNSPNKSASRLPDHVVTLNDVHVDIGSNIAGRDLSLCGNRTQMGDNKGTWLSNDGKVMDGQNVFSNIASPHTNVPISVCNTYVETKPQAGGHDKFATTLVPLTDKEIEIHKVLKFLHSQQDDAESGCSETMSTSDSGKGNSVSEETLENTNSRAQAPHKQVHFMPIQGHQGGASDKDYVRGSGATSPAFRNIPPLHSSQPNNRQNLSTFSSPNAKTSIKYPSTHNSAKRQPARVSFQCPPYDVHPPSHNQRMGSNGAKTPQDMSLPMYKIDECGSSGENLSDDTASTMSGSYVLQQDDTPHARASTPTTLSPAICRVLPTIQDSVV